MPLISLLLSLTNAEASKFSPIPDGNALIRTELGDVRKLTLFELCHSDRVYIADVAAVQSRIATLDSGVEYVVSDLEMTVVVPLKGTPPSRVVLEGVHGGETATHRTRSPDAPLPPVKGGRYVVGQKQLSDGATGARWIVTTAMAVDPLQPLSEGIIDPFRQAVRASCTSEDR